jgi:hypothetical protein
MHRKRRVGQLASSGHDLERSESLGRLLSRLQLWLSLQLVLSLELSNSWTVQRAKGQTTSLQGTTIEAGAVVVIALANDLTATDHNSTMAIAERTLRSLLKAKIQIVVSLHLVRMSHVFEVVDVLNLG